ncbi:MAG TPA: exodeoxyribonuclease III [bacterium]|nr:exodeoxyribonuclease III [bacterium]
MPKAAKPKPKAKSVPGSKAGQSTGTLKIATFNANSIRMRMPIVLNWLKKEQPDVLAVQETKVQDIEFPKEPLETAGWNVVFHGQKSYNGVAFISKKPFGEVVKRLYPRDPEEQARFLMGEYDGVLLINTYVPQGYAIDSDKYRYKLKYYTDLKKFFQKYVPNDKPALWMGDLNVAPTEIDLNNPKGNKEHPCFHIDARNALEETMKGKWTDLFREKEKGPGHYTFWDMRFPGAFEKNLGWRIDFLMGTPPMVHRLQKIWIDRKPRGLEKPSDHTFLVGEFSR